MPFKFNPFTHKMDIVEEGGGGGGVTTINGDTGSVTGSVISLLATPNSGSSVSFDGSGTTMNLEVSDSLSNTFIGGNTAGNQTLTGVANTSLGANENLGLLTTATANTAIGQASCPRLTSGGYNTFVGSTTAQNIVTGVRNTGIGYQALNAATSSASDNISVGYSASSSLTGTESNNIMIGSTGVVGDNHKIRIGASGSGTRQQNECYIGGIKGITGTGHLVQISASTDQLTDTSLNVVSTNGNNVIGTNAFGQPSFSGSDNIGFGPAVGGNYIGAESDNILIGNVGVTSENGAIHIGDSANQSTCFIAGISGTSGIGNIPQVSSSGQLLDSGITINNNSPNLANVMIAGGNNTASGTGNCIYGVNGAPSISSGANNAVYGSNAAFELDAGSNNTLLGPYTGYEPNTGTGLTSGGQNLIAGIFAGSNYTGAESGNTLLNSSGIVGESNAIHIGDQSRGNLTTATSCYVGGISGVTVTGTAVLCSTAGKLGTIVSSERYKENIEPIQESVSVLELQPKHFNYKTDETKTLQYGLIAEEVHQDFPYLCFYDKEGRPESVKYHELPVLLLNEIQRLNRRIRVLENK